MSNGGALHVRWLCTVIWDQIWSEMPVHKNRFSILTHPPDILSPQVKSTLTSTSKILTRLNLTQHSLKCILPCPPLFSDVNDGLVNFLAQVVEVRYGWSNLRRRSRNFPLNGETSYASSSSSSPKASSSTGLSIRSTIWVASKLRPAFLATFQSFFTLVVTFTSALLQLALPARNLCKKSHPSPRVTLPFCTMAFSISSKGFCKGLWEIEEVSREIQPNSRSCYTSLPFVVHTFWM